MSHKMHFSQYLSDNTCVGVESYDINENNLLSNQELNLGPIYWTHACLSQTHTGCCDITDIDIASDSRVKPKDTLYSIELSMHVESDQCRWNSTIRDLRQSVGNQRSFYPR